MTTVTTDYLILEAAQAAVKPFRDCSEPWFTEGLEDLVPALKKHTMPEWMTAAQKRTGRKLLAELYVRSLLWADELPGVEFIPFNKGVVLIVDAGGPTQFYDDFAGGVREGNVLVLGDHFAPRGDDYRVVLPVPKGSDRGGA